MSPLERLRPLFAAARRIADATDPLGREARARLPEASGLSPEGVELALTDHFEAAASADPLVDAAEPTARVWVLCAANVCTAPLRALAWALACAPQVRVRPSRRDPVVTELLVRAAGLGPQLELVAAVTPAAGDRVDAYGSDETLAALALPAGVSLAAHGTGLGVALVGTGEDLGVAAAALARDVVAFDQRGCLSPRFALVEGDATRARALADRLHGALSACGEQIPRGALESADRAALARWQQTHAAVGPLFAGAHHALALDEAPHALLLPPAARVLLVAPCSPERTSELLAPWARLLTAIGGAPGPLADAVARLAPHARRSPLGQMQRPPLDGPVDRRARGITRAAEPSPAGRP